MTRLCLFVYQSIHNLLCLSELISNRLPNLRHKLSRSSLSRLSFLSDTDELIVGTIYSPVRSCTSLNSSINHPIQTTWWVIFVFLLLVMCSKTKWIKWNSSGQKTNYNCNLIKLHQNTQRRQHKTGNKREILQENAGNNAWKVPNQDIPAYDGPQRAKNWETWRKQL